jgi:hypothetical protein
MTKSLITPMTTLAQKATIQEPKMGFQNALHLLPDPSMDSLISDTSYSSDESSQTPIAFHSTATEQVPPPSTANAPYSSPEAGQSLRLK